MSASVPYLGEFFSLLCAVVWALAVIFFRKSGERVHPLTLNLFKDILAFVLLIPTLWLFKESLLYPASLRSYLFLLASGVIGIGIGDTLFFMSLNLLGAGLTGIVVCTYAPCMIGLSMLVLREHMTAPQIIGTLLIITAVLVATVEKQSIVRRRLIIGIILGILSSLSTAIGAVIMKPILEQSPLVWTTTVRLFGGVCALAVIFAVYPQRHTLVKSLTTTKKWTYTIIGSLMGAYIAMLIWLAGLKYTTISIASALNQTSTIFIFVFGAFLLREPVTLRRALGIVLAFAGSFLVTFTLW